MIEVARAFAGFTAGEAEGLRRAMSRKRSEEAIESYRQRFITGALATHPDVAEPLAEEVWTMVRGFAGFGFPKAHGAAFGLLAYQSTYLRVHYPAEFLCALLNEQPMGFYPPDSLIHEAQGRGVQVLAPDVNRSEAECTVTEERRDPPRARLRQGRSGKGRRPHARLAKRRGPLSHARGPRRALRAAARLPWSDSLGRGRARRCSARATAHGAPRSGDWASRRPADGLRAASSSHSSFPRATRRGCPRSASGSR